MSSRLPFSSREYHDSLSYTVTPRGYNTLRHKNHSPSPYMVTPHSPNRRGIPRESNNEQNERYSYEFQNQETEFQNSYHHSQEHRSAGQRRPPTSSMNIDSARYHESETSAVHVKDDSRSPRRRAPYFPQFVDNEAHPPSSYYRAARKEEDAHLDRRLQPKLEDYSEISRRYKEGYTPQHRHRHPAYTKGYREDVDPREETNEYSQAKLVRHEYSRYSRVEKDEEQTQAVNLLHMEDPGELDPRAEYFLPPKSTISEERQTFSQNDQETAPLQKGQSTENLHKEKKSPEKKQMYADALLLAEMAQIAQGEVKKSSSTDQQDDVYTSNVKTVVKESSAQEEKERDSVPKYDRIQVYHHDRVDDLHAKFNTNEYLSMASCRKTHRRNSSGSNAYYHEPQPRYDQMEESSRAPYEGRYRVVNEEEDIRATTHYQQTRRIVSVLSGSSCESSSAPTVDRRYYPSSKDYKYHERMSWEETKGINRANRSKYSTSSYRNTKVRDGDIDRYDPVHQDRDPHLHRLQHDEAHNNQMPPSTYIRSAKSFDTNKTTNNDLATYSRTPSYGASYDDERHISRHKRLESHDSQNYSHYTRSNESYSRSTPPRPQSSPNKRYQYNSRNEYHHDDISRSVSEDSESYHYGDRYKRYRDYETSHSSYMNSYQHHSHQAAGHHHHGHYRSQYQSYRQTDENSNVQSPPRLKRQFETPPTPGADKSNSTDETDRPEDNSYADYLYHHQPPHKKITILRRKCAWKNYPELEAFLIENRDEYLRHSAMNYTVQQKQYNNRLTERLLDLAAKFGYIFDEADFNFVAVRDRIRCYYKSYVQSAKKRGILAGHGSSKKKKIEEHICSSEHNDSEEFSKTENSKTKWDPKQESQNEREASPEEDLVKKSIVIPDDGSITCET